MRVISSEEIQNLRFRSGGFGKGNEKAKEIYQLIGSLGLGQGVLITKEEWPLKGKPTPSNIRDEYKSDPESKFRVQRLEDDSGWVVIRTK